MAMLPTGSEGSEGRTNREMALLTELLSGLDQTTALLHAVAQSYGLALRRTGPVAREHLTQRDGEMMMAYLELQVEALAERVRAMGRKWRGGG